MWVAVEGMPDAVRLERGDVAVFDGSRAFVVASDPTPDPVDATRLFADTPGPMIRYGGGEDVVFVGGHVELGRAGEELLLHALLKRCCMCGPPRRRPPCCAGCSTSCCVNSR